MMEKAKIMMKIKIMLIEAIQFDGNNADDNNQDNDDYNEGNVD